MLNVSDITSKFHTVAIFVFVGLETLFHTECIGMLIIYPHITIYIPSSNGIKNKTLTKSCFFGLSVVCPYIKWR